MVVAETHKGLGQVLPSMVAKTVDEVWPRYCPVRVMAVPPAVVAVVAGLTLATVGTCVLT